MLVMGIKAVQFTVTVFADPIVTPPKSTGLVQFNGMDTGEPMQINLLLLSVTYSLPSPKAGRWNLFNPPVGGMFILTRLPEESGTAL